MEDLKTIVLLGIFLVCAGFPNVMAQDRELEAIYAGVEFDMPRVKETSFPDYSKSITEFGAKAGGLEKNTTAIEKAIADVSSKGGGRVIIPRGIWLTGPIILKSNINLHLEDGALLLFSRDFDDHHLIETSFEGLNTIRNISPIYAKGVENIVITGKGTIDGNGDAWRPVKKGKMTDAQWKNLVNSGGVLSDGGKMWFPSENSKLGHDNSTDQNVPDLKGIEEHKKVKDFLRPVMVSIRESKRILLDGPTFQNSPAWNIHPLMSEDIIIRNINVRNPWYSQNGDGLDLESCKNVLIYNNTFDVGDDAICFKSGKNKDGRDRGMPTENVIVKNNIVYHGHGGFVIGSEMSGGVKNIHISNCTFIGTDVGLQFKSTRGRGGVVENIYISNVDMINIPAEPIRFNMFYGGKSPIAEEGDEQEEMKEEKAVAVTEETPAFRNIFMKNITATGSGKAAFFMGLPEMSLQNVHLENSLLEAKEGITMVDASGISFKNVKVMQQKGPAIVVFNSDDVQVSNFEFNKSAEGKSIRVLGESKDINFSGKNLTEEDIDRKISAVSKSKKSSAKKTKAKIK